MTENTKDLDNPGNSDYYKDELSKWKEELYKARSYSEQSFDKLIVYLSAGGIIISITVFNEFIKQKYPINFCLILCVWVSYFVALFINLISHKFSRYSMDAELKNNSSKSHMFEVITELFNWFSLILFIAGSIILLTFIGVTYYGKQ